MLPESLKLPHPSPCLLPLLSLATLPYPPPQMLPESLNFAIVDEADSILIDESRNPMILSQPLYDTAQYVVVVDRVSGGHLLAD